MFRNFGKQLEKTVRKEAHRIEKDNRHIIKEVAEKLNITKSPKSEQPQIVHQENTATPEVTPDNTSLDNTSIASNENVNVSAESINDLTPYFHALLDNYLISDKQVSCYIFYNEVEQDEKLHAFKERLVNDLKITHKINALQKARPKLGENIDQSIAVTLQAILNADYVISIASKQGLQRYQQANSSNQTLQEPQSIYAVEYGNIIKKFKAENGKVIPILYDGTAQECLPTNMRACSLVYTDLANTPKVEDAVAGDYYHNFIQLMDSFGLVDSNNVSILNNKLDQLTEAFKQGKSKNELLQITNYEPGLVRQRFTC